MSVWFTIYVWWQAESAWNKALSLMRGGHVQTEAPLLGHATPLRPLQPKVHRASTALLPQAVFPPNHVFHSRQSLVLWACHKTEWVRRAQLRGFWEATQPAAHPPAWCHCSRCMRHSGYWVAATTCRTVQPSPSFWLMRPFHSGLWSISHLKRWFSPEGN